MKDGNCRESNQEDSYSNGCVQLMLMQINAVDDTEKPNVAVSSLLPDTGVVVNAMNGRGRVD